MPQAGVYLLRLGSLVKIGCSDNLARRCSEVVAEHHGSELLHFITCPQARDLELALHRRFFSSRMHGEWFELSEADLALLLAVGPLDSADALPSDLRLGSKQTETARISHDLMEMMREICFYSGSGTGSRLRVQHLLDSLLRPLVEADLAALRERLRNSSPAP